MSEQAACDRCLRWATITCRHGSMNLCPACAATLPEPVSAKAITDLHARTGLPMRKCREALEKAGGDPAKAILVLWEEASTRRRRTGDLLF